MWNFISPRKMTISLVMLTSLVALLTSCGSNITPNNAQSTRPTVTPGTGTPQQAVSTPTVEQATPVATPQQDTPSLANLLTPNKDNVATDTNGLHIQENGGFHCAKDYSVPVNLVLTSNQLTYDQGQMQQLAKYINSVGFTSDTHSSQVPSSLRWVEGASAGSNTGRCNVTFQLTNTGSTAIQISRVALRVREQPFPNTFAYRLIDQCSLFPPGQCPGMGGVPGYCEGYNVNLSLSGAKLNDEIGDKPSAGNDANGAPCPELTLAPQKSTTLAVSASGSSFIYSVIPEFTAITTQGQSTLALPSFTSNLAFSNQFSCYAIKGNNFVVEQGPSNSTIRCI